MQVSPPTVDQGRVADAVAALRGRIGELAGGRDVQIVAVTKGFGSDAIRAAAAAGCSMVGENYAQELVAKVDELGGLDADGLPQVHFIGRLQTNKVRHVAAIVDVWQSVDRPSIVDEIARRAARATVFVQVNATGEAGKGGCLPDHVEALVRHCRAAQLDVAGLMAVGPTSPSAAATGEAFALVRRLADDNGLIGRSMGMSADMEIAIEHGATHVRIGSALFGQRPHPRARIG
ncbi:MAG: YggS family pyridoxal phosphate-dependent enzyme [Ilumatobacteraceae bacterium]